MTILYLSSVLPKRSETFVYGEVLGLRELGLDVPVATLHPPERGLDEPRLERLADEAVPVYGGGWAALLADALRFALAAPAVAARVMLRALRDALDADDLGVGARAKPPLQAVAALALARRLAGRGVTHIHIHMAHAAATVGMYAAQALGVPFSFTGHAADLFRERCLLRRKLGRARFVVCISDWHRQWYRGLVARDDRAYPVVRCGVDIPERPPERAACGTLRILGLGRLVPKKGFGTLVEACRQLTADGIAVACVIAGDGPEEAALKQAADGLPVEFPGAVAHHEVPRLLAACEVCVLPCQTGADGDRDGIPVVLMEAMAHGVCVVSGDLPTIRELVRDGETGLLVPPGQPRTLAARLAELQRHPQRRRALAAAGRQLVRNDFSRDGNLNRLVQLFASDS